MRQAAVTTLAVGALLVTSGAQPRLVGGSPAVAGRAPNPPVTRTLPLPEEPAYVHEVVAPATRGWRRAGDLPRQVALADELLSAYSFAVAVAPERCHLQLSLLAAVGQVESGNAAGHRLDAGHRVVPAIVGPVLDGSRFAAVPDTDGAVLDGDARWDHAVGPFQFLPTSWRVAGVDFDDDGVRDPQDVYDAAGAAMVYLCADDRDLADPAQLEAAVLAYNHSRSYLRTVLAWKAAFDRNGVWDGSPIGSFVATPVAAPPAPARPVGAVARPHAVTSGAEPTPDAPPPVREPVDLPGPDPQPDPEPVPEPGVPPADCAPVEPPAEEPLPVEPSPADPPADDPPADDPPADDPPADDPPADAQGGTGEPTTPPTTEPPGTAADGDCVSQPGTEDPADPSEPSPVPSPPSQDPATTAAKP
jgi:hypothetical protein